MKKISSKKLQLRSSIIALLAGPDLRIMQGGTGGIGCGGGGMGSLLNRCNASDGAGVTSQQDNDTNPVNCNIPITTC